jgi:hypothetical protein
VDVQSTLAELAFLRKLELDTGCTATLLVVNVGSLARTESNLATRAAMWHLVCDEDIRIPRSRQVERADRERRIGSVYLEGITIIAVQLSTNTIFLVNV